MQLSFNDVSFSYNPPRRRGTAARPAAPAADWGVDPASPWALQHVTFTVEEGDFLGIAGHTGSGKSTLVQHANGLLHPTQGTVTFNGQDLSAKGATRACRESVGVVFQYPEHQLFANTVFDDVAFGPRNLGLNAQQVAERVNRALQEVELDPQDVGEKSPFELSGGQQRRVAFAGVLAMEPQVLVLDEPAAGLDPAARSSFLSLISRLHEGGLTVVMVSHSMDDLAMLCNRIVIMNQGQVFAQGTPAQVFADREALHAIGLDVPQAQRMALELRKSGFTLPQSLYATPHQLARDIARELQAIPAEGR